jgi:hypothetical protein
MLEEGLHTDVIIFTLSGSVDSHQAILVVKYLIRILSNFKQKRSAITYINDVTLGSYLAFFSYLYGDLKY